MLPPSQGFFPRGEGRLILLGVVQHGMEGAEPTMGSKIRFAFAGCVLLMGECDYTRSPSDTVAMHSQIVHSRPWHSKYFEYETG